MFVQMHKSFRLASDLQKGTSHPANMWALKGSCVVILLNLCLTSYAQTTNTKTQQAVNNFSVELLKELSGDAASNLVVSPVSVSTLLALLYQGARNSSASQLGQVLGLTQQEAKEGYGQLSSGWQEPRNQTAVLEVANRLFVKRDFPLNEEFTQVAVQDFRSGVEHVTFGTGEGGAAINDWVSEATHGRIPSIVDPDTVVVLANAIFFKSPWQERFSKHLSANQTFSPASGTEVTVPFMYHYGERFRAGVDTQRGLQWVQLPFEGGDYSMLIIVPTVRWGLSSVLSNFSGDTLSSLLEAGSYRDVTLALPRFKLSSKLPLEAPLGELGARDIFDQSAADLSGISSSGRLYVSKALQKADIEVDEEGATAAAATVIGIQLTSGHLPRNPITITADHPFLAAILDHANRLPLFVATVTNPSQT